MRKNSPRKWLHACLDLLPVILIPVFMIYSHRHEINTGSIEVPQKLAVDFNQQAILRNSDNAFKNYTTIDGGELVFDSDFTNTGDTAYVYVSQGFTSVVNHVYIARCTSNMTETSTFRYADSGCFQWGYSIPLLNGSIRFVSLRDVATYFSLRVPTDYTIVADSFLSIQVFDLTQMFGEGNEPSLNDFNIMFPNSYYEYTLSHKELIDNGSITYDDTDIMSQMTYQLYNSVDKYFNMGNVFNMNGVYDWFNLNIFNGSAPIYIYVVWQIVLYEFVMDLLFLLYGLFMWFIDIVQHLMDKPFKSIK